MNKCVFERVRCSRRTQRGPFAPCRPFVAQIEHAATSFSSIVVIVEVVAPDDLGLMVAPPLGEVLVVLGELRRQRVHGGRVGRDDDLLTRGRAAPEAAVEAAAHPLVHAELGDPCKSHVFPVVRRGGGGA